MRFLVTALLGIHGAVHLLGLAKWGGLADVPALGGRTLFPLESGPARVFAVCWLLATLLLMGAAGLRVAFHPLWWLPAALGVVLSQGLIVVAWADAKLGTVANLILVVPVLFGWASARFDGRIAGELTALQGRPPVPGATVTAQDLAPLPAPVARWLSRSGVVGRSRASFVRLTQRGEIRTAPDKDWMQTEAEQHFSVGEPGFVWRVQTKMAGLPILGRDLYAEGRGHMLITVGGLVPIVDARDEKIALGSLLRYLGEIVWFPSAALAPYLRWEPLSETSARVTMAHGGMSAAAMFDFDAEGRVTGMRAERYLGGGAEAQLRPWVVTCTEWRKVRGLEIPVRGDVSWKLPEGDFSYYRWEILDVE